MSLLAWITDEKLDSIVDRLLQRSRDGVRLADQKMQKNVMDPFASLIMSAAMDISEIKPLHDIQCSNSASQAISSAVGSFHQEVLGSVGGFHNHDSDYDLENMDRKIIAEVKNKHNTMNATSRKKVISDLETAVRQKSGKWTAYLVIIVPKTPSRYSTNIVHGQKVSEIDGASFYEMVTGHKTALRDLYAVLQKIILPQHSVRANEELLPSHASILNRSLPA